jgi:phage regulator Rha-like protein
MKEIVLKTQIVGNDKQQMMTSLEIAELTGKQHKHVMEAIRKMEPAWVKTCGSNFRLTSRNMEPGWEKVAGLKFQLGSYKDLNGQLRPCYSLTKTECLYIATKFNDEAKENVSGAEWCRLLYNGVKKRCFLDVFVVFC